MEHGHGDLPEEVDGTWDISSSLLSACFEKYRTTPSEELEFRRLQLGALLLGLFAVEVLRFVASPGQLLFIPGLVVCLVGNRARCSLRPWDLTLFVALAAVVAVTDLVSLVAGWRGGFPEIAESFRLSSCQRVGTTGDILAPMIELLCVKVASGSYLKAEHLFVDVCSFSRVHGAYEGCTSSRRHSSSNSSTSCPTSAVTGSIVSPLSSLADYFCTFVSDAFGEAQDRKPLRETEAVLSMPAPLPSCQECGAEAAGYGAGFGTGIFAESLYCSQCWKKWYQVT